MAGTPSSSVGSSSAGALTQIYANVAAGAIASWDVTGIAGTYNHLLIVCQARGDAAATGVNVLMRFNGDTGANYDYQSLLAKAAVPSSAETFGATSVWIGDIAAATGGANLTGIVEVTVPNYAATVFNKELTATSGFKRGVATTDQASQVNAGAWRSSTAITQVTIFPSSGNFVLGSRLQIYGIT